MITEDYVTLEIAELLKQKGFNEVTYTYYLSNGSFYLSSIAVNNKDLYAHGHVSAPTIQMAMKWLREVHHCVICVTPLTFYCGEKANSWGYTIWADDNTEVDEESSPRLESYEEACETAIKYCLENLIL